METGDRWMDAAEVASYLSVTVPAIRKWQAERRIPYVKLGRLVRFKKSDLDKWLESKTVTEYLRNVY